MHELAITQSIAEIVLNKQEEVGAIRVKSVWIEAGMVRNLIEEWVQRYFGYHTEGTPAEGAVIHVNRIPVRFRCLDCGAEFGLPAHNPDRLHCPDCGGDNYRMVAGQELSISCIEFEFPDTAQPDAQSQAAHRIAS